jgi:ketosteroid isomerase-like protein
MNQRIFAIVFFSAATVCRALTASVTDDPADPAVVDVRAREEDYTRGVRNKDITLLNKLFAESFIDTSETGKLINKQEYFEALKADHSTIESLVTDQFKILVYGDAAVASSRFVLKGKDENGKSVEEIGRATDVWVKQNGKWMCVAAHSSPIKPEK